MFRINLPTVLGLTFATCLTLGASPHATAAPPPGMRWSDHAGLTSPQTRPAPVDQRRYGFQPSYGYQRYPHGFSSAPLTPAVVVTTAPPVTVYRGSLGGVGPVAAHSCR